MDRLAKEAAVENGPIVYDKMPKEVLLTQQKENGLQMWQRQWTDTEKGAVTKAFFPSVRNRIRQKIPVFPELTTMLIGHGKIRSYLYRFGLTNNAMCPCEEEEETVDHLIFKCKKLNKNRNEMIKQIKNNGGNWPTSNETLVNNYLNFFVTFVKSIDFTDLQRGFALKGG